MHALAILGLRDAHSSPYLRVLSCRCASGAPNLAARMHFYNFTKQKSPASTARLSGGRQHNLRRDNAHRLALQSTFNAEGHLAVNLGEQRVILAHADILARVHLGAALTDDNAAGGNQLLAKSLDAQTLGM